MGGQVVGQSLYGGSFDAECTACGTAVFCDKRTILKWPVRFPGLEDIKEIGVVCTGCGNRWSLGYTSGELERIADRILKAKADPVEQAILQAQYLRTYRKLQVDMAARKRAGQRGEETGRGQERPASIA